MSMLTEFESGTLPGILRKEEVNTCEASGSAREAGQAGRTNTARHTDVFPPTAEASPSLAAVPFA